MLQNATIELTKMNLTITININGETKTSSAETLGALVEGLGMKPDRVAIELNREIVPRDEWPQTPLRDGDRLEIVHFVGGGTSLNDLSSRAERGIYSSPQ
jgi:thiamine biosynthesis protein ThiS